MNLNKYYTVLRPFDVLRAVGRKPSNTYIGASQVIDTIFETVTVQINDELHDLIGGLFHVDASADPYVTRMTKPPHIFEAHYHRGVEAARIESLLRDGYLCVESAPAAIENYRANKF